MIYIIIIIVSILFFGCICFYTIYLLKRNNKDNNNLIDTTHVNENSFQNYAKFYGESIPSDKDFDRKLSMIYSLITNNKMTDIKDIANSANCSIAECVLKIKYLKNKRLIDDLYIDTNNMKLLPCSLKDQQLLDKYKPYIYGNHSQIVDIITTLSNPDNLNTDDFKKKVLEELLYLDSKNLLNGIKIDDIDGEIIYYSVEKRKTVKNMETVHCSNCGALNDVEITGKVRCGYCNSIVIGTKYQS